MARTKKIGIVSLTKFLSYMNAYLASLSNIFPIAGVIKEFKEFIESSVGVNQRL